MVIFTTANRPFEKIFLNVVGPLPRSRRGNSFYPDPTGRPNEIRIGIPNGKP